MKKEIYGEISLEELKSASMVEDVQGGATPTVATPYTPQIVEGTIALSVAFCPTTTCTSKC